MNANVPSPLSPTVFEPTPNAAERARWVERYRRSGLTQRAFAAAHGLQAGRLHYWLYGPRAAPRPGLPGPRLQEVRVEGWTGVQRWSAEVGLPDGRTLRLDAPLARELLAPLLTPR